ncbi:hypothetical protein CHS0354_010436 [Potamilus streckersoni]|uniref:WD repeat-containing protein 34 n=1 Tax=Potamilus streckersoni TaxID=2493646 RepID=A0AAE0SR90_9BIVA|nr:hypothetical protein CHS0354_010436 [Potamilus streckersoni]
MFTDESLDGVDIKSTWRKERDLASSSVQTEDLLISDAAVQSIKWADEAIQTDEEPEKKFWLAQDTSGRLVDFLRRVEPYILRQLQKNLQSRAFDDYEVGGDEEKSAVTIVHTLTHADLNNKFQVTGLSWNSTGSVIAASYGNFEHEDWCTHKASLCTWNLDRRNINENKADTAVELSSCLMCIAFHPQNPALIAGGNFNGEVMLWDLSREDDTLVCTSGIGDDAHQEPVSKVHWFPDSKGKRFSLVSIGTDGKILVWKVDRKHQKLSLKDGFVLMNQSLPRKMKVKGVRGDKEIGATCISYNSEDRDMFLVGSEAGAIFKCSMHAQGNPAGSHIVSSIPLRSPVTFTYSPHHGPVYSVECSPFHRNAFISSAMDQCIRLYSILQAQPVMTIEPGEGYIYSVAWSPIRPTLIAAVAETGNLLLYDLKHGQPTPVQKLGASPQKQPVYTCQFNSHQTEFLATGDAAGYIQIFKLSQSLRKVAAKDAEFIGKLVSVAAE